MEERRRRGQSQSFGSSGGDAPSDPLFGAGQSFGGGERPVESRGRQGDTVEEQGRRSFEAPQPPSRPFETPQPQNRPYETPQPQSRPFETPQPQSRPYETPQPQNRTYETPQPQSRSFQEQGNDRARAREAEKPLPRPPMETRRSEPDPGEQRSRAPLFLAGGVVALIVAVGAGIVIMSHIEDPVSTAGPAASARPSAPAPIVGAPDDKYGFAASRKTDPQPLSLKELFGHKKVSAHGRSYLMTVRRADKKCNDAVHGTGIQKALTTARCTQFLRASFRDAPGKLIGTVGVANLSSAASAKKAAKAGTGGELEDYVTPLPGKDSATKLLGGGGDSYATAWSQGHYLVLLWFQYKDGHKPSKTELKHLNQAAVDITEASVFSALDTRALTGARSN
jgi:hypothetical protein